MTAKIRAFGRFWYDFIVGDDWLLAGGVVAILVASWLLHQVAEDAAWILLTVATPALLYASVKRAVR